MSEQAPPAREPLPGARQVAASAVAFGSGFLLSVAVHRHEQGTATSAIFAAWLLGPLVAGVILRTMRLIPYLIIGVLWFVTLPIQSTAGLTSVPAAGSDPSGPRFVTTFTLAALPLAAPLVGAFAFGAGFGVRFLRERFSGHGLQD